MANIVSEVHIESVEDGREVDENGFITLRIEASIPLSHISTRRLAPLDAPPPASIAQNIDQDDADYLPRRPRRRGASPTDRERVVYTVSHMESSNLDGVGAQLWRGAFLLSDYLIHNALELRHSPVLEVGGGVGLLGVILASVGVRSIVTDRDTSITDIALRNVSANAHLASTACDVRVLDWMDEGTWPTADSPNPMWSPRDLEYLSQPNLTILCADCIYDEHLTDALFAALTHLLHLSPSSRVLLALEKRFNFSLAELSVVAHGYRRFLRYLGRNDAGVEVQGDRQPIPDLRPDQHVVPLYGQMIQQTFPQYLRGYERSAQLELWVISREPLPEPPRPPQRVAEVTRPRASSSFSEEERQRQVREQKPPSAPSPLTATNPAFEWHRS